MSIIKDLKAGKDGENMFLSLLKTNGISGEQIEGKFLDFDIKAILDMDEITFEVKNDLYAKKSGNIAIEIFNPKSNTASGLTATKATFWIHILEKEIWGITTERLRRFIDDNKPHRTIDRGGDNNAMLLLYKKEDILKVFTRLENLPTKDFISFLKER